VADYPKAQARLEQHRDGYLWVIDCCPLCGGKHTHGGGLLFDEPTEYLGHRVAHCGKVSEVGGYILEVAA